jgi:hypothetical protein
LGELLPQGEGCKDRKVRGLEQRDRLAKRMRKMKPCDAARILIGAGCGSSVGGGGDLVFRYVKSLKTFDAKGQVTLSSVADALKTLDNKAAADWARVYVSGLEPNKANLRRLANFLRFIDAGGYGALALALSEIESGRWWTLSETIKFANGASETYSIDVRREIQNRFGLRLTDARRIKQGAIAPIEVPALAA